MNATTKPDTIDDSAAAEAQAAEAEEATAEAVTENADDSAPRDSAAHDAAPHDSASEEETGEGEAEDGEPDADPAVARRSGVGAGAGAVVAAALAFVALSGSWMGTVLSERKTLTGQIHLPQGASAAQQIHEVYAAPWHTTALVNGGFALLALIVGVVVLALPLFSTPARTQAVWVRAVAWGSVAVAVIGLVIAAGMYFDLFAALPSAPAATSTPTQ
ncbi:hypothetical protein [Streptomyces sp. NBC_01500]|uniref:hypothetical protein n=1 Tax=Streptomyces sp. NBC_01500 TaxID=2903886 RepID=UPI00224EA6F8|nr:hypothetical protein [Streptomyces sp. NBC_01500]MCX4547992.1 hypothetical protein [Streptomyces sp. NBC_01500]